MPGMTARLDPVPGVNDGGRLYVSGPNVMLGYLRAEKSRRVGAACQWLARYGRHCEQSTPRASLPSRPRQRFAKVGGEMISLAAVETLASELWPDALSRWLRFPMRARAKSWCWWTQARTAKRSDFQAFAKERGASDLMIPAEVLVEDKLPLLGSGKLDYTSVTKLVRDRMAAPQQEALRPSHR